MKKQNCILHNAARLLLGLLTTGVCGAASVQAAPSQPNTLTPKEEAEGWQLLFDGHSVDQWRGFRRADFPKKGWVVQDGCLTHVDHHGGGDIITRKLFNNYEFKFEWRVGRGANSGVKYFISEKRGAPIGHEYQLIDDWHAGDARRGGKHETAAFYDVLPATNRVLKPVGEFNSSRIVVQGKHVEHWLNGKRVLEYELGSPRVQRGIAHSKFRRVKGFDDKFPSPILLQDHGGQISFRNLKIRELPPK